MDDGDFTYYGTSKFLLSLYGEKFHISSQLYTVKNKTSSYQFVPTCFLFPQQKTQQQRGGASLEGLNAPRGRVPCRRRHGGELVPNDSAETRRLTRENTQRGNAELEPHESSSPLSHFVSSSFVFISALRVCVRRRVREELSLLFSSCLGLYSSSPFFFPLISPASLRRRLPAPSFIPGSPLTPSRSLSPLIAFTFIPLCLPAH